jgi:3-oxoadipate enol-lactonase
MNEPTEVKIETGFADVNGTRLYYEVAGSGDPIVLIHGNYGDCRDYGGQFEAFAKSHRVLRYDVRAFGKSSLPVEGIAYSDPDDLKALLGYLGISKAHIAGYSMGSGIAVDFALTYPEMSNSLISIGPWANGHNSPAAKELFKGFGEIPSILKESGAKAVAEHIINDPSYNTQRISSDLKNSLTETICDFPFWHFLHEDPRRYIDPPAVQQLDRISLPILIVTAEYDIEACREIADLMEQEIPNAKKVDIPDATHFMLMEKPEEFNEAVLDFLNEI